MKSFRLQLPEVGPRLEDGGGVNQPVEAAKLIRLRYQPAIHGRIGNIPSHSPHLKARSGTPAFRGGLFKGACCARVQYQVRAP